MLINEILTVSENSSYLGLHNINGHQNYIFISTIEVFNHFSQPIILRKGEFFICYFGSKTKSPVNTKEKTVEIAPGKRFKFKIGFKLTSDIAFAEGKLTFSTLNSNIKTKIDTGKIYLSSTPSLN
ncbi:MAG: hypothetical protein ABFR62_06085 [Bacteroidota bacterium]